jgi:hypothetical protein
MAATLEVPMSSPTRYRSLLPIDPL